MLIPADPALHSVVSDTERALVDVDDRDPLEEIVDVLGGCVLALQLGREEIVAEALGLQVLESEVELFLEVALDQSPGDLQFAFIYQ